jgi:fucose permease
MPVSILSFAVAGLALGPIFPTILAAAGARYPGRSESVSGFLLAASIVGAVVCQPLMGLMSDLGCLRPAMAGAGLAAFASCAALLAVSVIQREGWVGYLPGKEGEKRVAGDYPSGSSEADEHA